MSTIDEQLFRLSDDLCFVMNDKTELQAINPAVTEVLGWTADELAGKPLLDSIYHDDREALRTAVGKVGKVGGATSTIRVVARHMTRSGHSPQLRWKLALLEDGFILAMARPLVSEERDESDIEKLFHLSRDLLCVVDNMQFRLVNPAFTTALGWTAAELTSRPCTNFIHPDDLETSVDATEEYMAGERVTSRYQNRLITADGSHVWVEWYGASEPEAPHILYSVGRDVTELRRLREELEQARDSAELARAEVEETALLYRQILDSIQDLVLVKGEASRLIWGNRAFREYYGMSEEELQGIIDAPQVDPDITQQYVQDDLRVWNTGKPLLIPEEPVVRHDGAVTYVETVKAPIFDSQGKIKMIVGVARDLTRRKEADELRRARDEAELARRAAETANRAKSSFLANMSHELRTPLNAILGYAQIMARDLSLGEKHRQAVDSIRRSGEHLLTLISDILDLSKIEAGKLDLVTSEFHLDDFLASLADVFEMRAKQQRLTFSYQAASALPMAICTDETRLRQVLINLLSNALKFTEAGGVWLRVAWNDGKLRVEVEDTGIGIDQTQLEAIFHPFEQLANSTDKSAGTGLGLPISKQLVELMGGSLQASSEPGKGSLFWFEIPAEAVSGWKPPQRTRHMIAGYEGERKKLLIVDDKAENRNALSQLLDSVGFDLVEATNGVEAIARATEEQPDLIFMDLVMPELDGFEATRQMRAIEALNQTPIIAVSASVFDRVHERSMYAGCDGFVAKPFNVDDVFDALAEHLGLTWRYYEPGATKTTDTSTAATAPDQPRSTLSEDELASIYSAATIGDIQSIMEIVGKHVDPREVSAADPSALAIEAEIYLLAKRFQARKIRELLKPLVEES